MFLKNPIKSWQDNNLIKSNIYEKKLYEINAFKNKKSYMLNLFALPKEKLHNYKFRYYQEIMKKLINVSGVVQIIFP